MLAEAERIAAFFLSSPDQEWTLQQTRPGQQAMEYLLYTGHGFDYTAATQLLSAVLNVQPHEVLTVNCSQYRKGHFLSAHKDEDTACRGLLYLRINVYTSFMY